MPNNRHRVTKSNDLVTAGYKLTLNEQRLILSAISRVDPRKTLPIPICIYAHDFSEQFNIPIKQAYEALKDASGSLYERDVKTFDGRYRSRFRWVDRVDYLDGKAEARVYFTVHVRPYLAHLNRRFTTYELRRVAGLSSVHSIRLFELLQQFRSTGFMTITVSDFREYLELGKSYERYSNLKLKVIDPAIIELKTKSGLAVAMRSQKSGRAVERLHFNFFDEPQSGKERSAVGEPESMDLPGGECG